MAKYVDISQITLQLRGLKTREKIHVSDGIEITAAVPFIDFHFNNDSVSDYTMRLAQFIDKEIVLNGGRLKVSGDIYYSGNLLKI